jgi:SAM-dependent methyltransferase
VTKYQAQPSADGYSRRFSGPRGVYFDRVETAPVLAAAGPLEGRAVLDLGCGTGRFAALASRAGARHVIALDKSAAMLDVARTSFRDARVEWRLGDLYLTDFTSDGPFDVVFAVGAFEDTSSVDLRLALERVTRTLAPGGRIVLTLWNRERWLALRALDFGENAHEFAMKDVEAVARELGLQPTHMRSAMYEPRRLAGLLLFFGDLPGVGAVIVALMVAFNELLSRIAPLAGRELVVALSKR